MGGKRVTPAHRNRDFTKEEIEILSLNPNVKNVSAKQINYTDAFKIHFLEQYQAGKMPLEIFTQAGFDQKILGQGRIDKAAARWKRKANRPGGVCDQKKGHSGRRTANSKELTLEEEILYLKQQNAYLRQENSFLREIQRLESFHLILQAYKFKNRYKGARGIKMVLFRQYSVQMNLKKIRRLMKKYHLVCPIRKANPYRKVGKAILLRIFSKEILIRGFQEKFYYRILHIFIMHLENVHIFPLLRTAAQNR